MTRGGKLLYLYKRPGKRVIVNDKGHMMVGPAMIEFTLQQNTAGKTKALHLSFIPQKPVSPVAGALQQRCTIYMHVTCIHGYCHATCAEALSTVSPFTAFAQTW